MKTSIAKPLQDFRTEREGISASGPSAAEIPENAEDVSGLTSEAIEAMMDVLISKEVLYEPLLSLDQSVLYQFNRQYDDWAQRHTDNEKGERARNIIRQRSLIKEILTMFNDEPAEITSAKKKIIFEKMQQVQELGLPPEEVAAKLTVFLNQAKIKG